MRCLVTGGAGFIGSHVVDALVEKGHEVVVLDNLFSGKRENVNKKAMFVKASIMGDLSKIFAKEKFDCVFHLAAQANLRLSLTEPAKDTAINIGGSLNIIEECIKHKVKKIVFSSTAAIYSPEAEIPVAETGKIEPMSPYGLSKITVERYLNILKRLYGFDYTILRYANVYGPRQNPKGEGGVVSVFFDKLANGQNLKIFGDGKQTRDFVYVKDVAAANLLAFEKNIPGVFNVSSMKETSVNELIEKMIKASGKNAKIERGEEVRGELRRSCLDNRKLRSAGWEQKYDLENGLKETAKFFIKN